MFVQCPSRRRLGLESTEGKQIYGERHDQDRQDRQASLDECLPSLEPRNPAIGFDHLVVDRTELFVLFTEAMEDEFCILLSNHDTHDSCLRAERKTRKLALMG